MRSDADKKQALLDIVENWLPYVEAFWSPSDVSERQTDFFFDRDLMDGVEQPRASGCVAMAYATLLTAYPERATFGPTLVPRETLLSHAEQTIRHELATHRRNLPDPAMYVVRCTYAEHEAYALAETRNGGSKFPLSWPINPSFTATDIFGWAWATHLLGDAFRADTRARAAEIVEFELGELLARTPEHSPRYGKDRETADDSHADQHSWDAAFLMAGASIFPNHPDAPAWIEHAQTFAVNASTVTGDRASSRSIDGVELRAWATTATINDDLSLVNHGIFHPSYSMGTFMMLGDGAVFLAQAGRAVPEALRFRLEEIWDAVIGRLTTADGEVLHPVSTDWTAHDMQHVGYLSQIATVLRRDDASALESVAIERLAARQAASVASIEIGGRSVEVRGASLYGMADFAYESENIRSCAMAWWQHELFGPSPTPSEAEVDAARAGFMGVHELPDAEVMVHVSPSALTTISWRSTKAPDSQEDTLSEPAGQIVPWSRDHAGDEVFTRAIPYGLWGRTPGSPAAPSTERRNGFFSSACITTDGASHRYLSVTSFADGSVLLLDRGAGEAVGGTFRFAFERIPGMTSERPVHTADGVWNYDDGPAMPSGDWANVADRFGLIVAGGGGLELTPVPDVVPYCGSSPYIRLDGSKDGGSGNRGAIVLPLATHEQTAQLAPFLSQPNVSDEHWSALTAHGLDGRARISVARWGGAETAAISGMTSPLGVPIPDRPEDVTVDGVSGSTRVTLDCPASTGWIGCFWAESTSEVTIRPISETRVEIANGSTSTALTIRWVNADGAVHEAQATLAASAVAHANATDDGVAIS